MRHLATMWPFFDVSRRRLSVILDLFDACLDHLRSVDGGLYRCAKFGWDRPFEGMRVSVLCELGLKMPIHAPFVFWG